MLKFINIYKLFFSTLLLTFTLIGCGGGGVSGGGSSSTPSDPYTFSVLENQTSAVTATVNHTNTLTYSLASGITDNNDFNINASTAVVTFKVAPNYEIKTQYKVTVHATDGLAFNSDIVYTINITDLNDPNTFNVAENQSGAITASINSTSTLTYSLAATNDNDDFNIDSSTAVVTFKVAPDYETKTQYTITVHATDGLSYTSDTVYTINISNVDDDAPVFVGSFTPSALENQTSAFTASATDSNTITYSLSAGVTDNNDFSINSTSGVVIFNTAPDYETKTSYSITVTATDSLSNVSTQVYTLGITNIDDDAPVFTGSFTATVAENQTSATTANTTDLNTVTYSLGSGVTDNDDFNVNSSSGVITFKVAPNFEIKASYSITVTATDSLAYSSTQVYTITISDVDENAPVFNAPYVISGDENQTSVSAISVTDASTITYSLTSGVTENNSFSINSSSGAITFNSAPNYEALPTKTSYTITVTATDSLSNTSSQAYTVNVNDVDENPPVFTGSFTPSAAENQKTAFTASATDASTIAYSLGAGVTDNDTFSINSSSGVVTFKLYPDFEATPTKTSFSITVTATDTQSNSDTQIYTLGLTDVNENLTFNSLPYKFIISQITGRFWLDRNIGATQVCTSSGDTACYGNLYQWGRLRDGHQLSSSTNSATRATNIISSGSNFITNSSSPMDWLTNSTQDTDDIDDNGNIRNILWSQTNGDSATNNIVCPSGYRMPSVAEIKAETLDDSIADTDTNSNGTIEVINSATAFQNFLKLPTSGYRNNSGTPVSDGFGYLWSSSVSGGNASSINYDGTTASENTSTNLVNAYPIRCIQHTSTNTSTTIDAGTDQIVYQGATVTLTATAGFTSYEWRDGNTPLGSAQSLVKSDFAVGIHYLSLIGTDSNGEKSVDTITVTVKSTSISHNSINYIIVTSPYTTKKWLDRNIGASQVCSASNDLNCYGDYFQWGRLADGHEKQTSTTTATTIAYNDDTSNEYITPAEWGTGDTSGALRVARWNQITGNVNGVSGATYTDVCPVGFRVPTQAEVISETTSQGVSNNATAFSNFLKLPVAGFRKDDGTMQNVGSIVYLWYNTPNGTTEAKYLRVSSGTAAPDSSLTRAFGGSVRCIED
ncbi:cadherin domain-containing protein [Poseidonibacter lekithochrous]|uniref:cadherin domain-containing protein n=1 Tax=Poseidonibacter lekithochrous TaxID=1904463 RepID=UPI0008FCB2FD|nr:cadherin domain-containing protein [Poseidonibacter lekithochrous]QKJ24407.1 cadherin repeat domain-containing protein [Poseidonibacter lekithochrous]